MDKKELMSYLKDAYKLESQLYTLNRLKEKYENSIIELEEQISELLCKQEEFDQTKNAKGVLIWCQGKKNLISTEYSEMILEIVAQTEMILEKLYSNNFILPKYQNFVSVSQIYEYLDTKKCDEIDGAYNLFESELRQNTIVVNVDELVNQFEQFNSTMCYVVSSINQMNTILESISNQLGSIIPSLNTIQVNTILATYYHRCISFNDELIQKYNLYM